MKHTIRALTATCSLLFVAAAIAGDDRGAQPSIKPNVIFILADDLGIGGLHLYGTEYISTPHIDSLGAEGMRFTEGLAAYPTCKPSRAAIISGQYGPRTGVYRVKNSYGDEDKAKFVIPDNGQLSPKKQNLAQVFKSAGYTTAMFGKWHVSNENQTHPKTHYGYDVAYVSNGAHYKAKSNPAVDLPEGMMIEEKYTHMACDFMGKAVQDKKPFYLYMPYFLVHAPFTADPDKRASALKRMEGKTFIKQGDKDLATVVAMTEMLDDCIGILLQKVKDLGIEDHTIILFTSDNGSYDLNLVGEYRGRKGDTYDGGMRVPYVFKWGNQIKPASISAERIIGVDIYPTLLALAGISPSKTYPLDGADLSPLLLGETASLPARDIFCFYPKYSRYNERKKRWACSWRNVIYSGDFKLIEYPEYNEYELFALDKDPKETTNLSRENPEKKQQLIKKLHSWLKEIKAPKVIPNPNYKP